MTPSGQAPEDIWMRLRPQLGEAFACLAEQLEVEGSRQDLFDAYLDAKKQAAEAFQALARMHFPTQDTAWKVARETLAYEINRRYESVGLPEGSMRIPYGSRTHLELFSILVERLDQPVPADLLRVITADSVHTERRVRELRELGLDIHAIKTTGTDAYILKSLDIDFALLPGLIKKNLDKMNNLTAGNRNSLLSEVRKISNV